MGAPHAAGRIVLLTLQATDDAAVLSLIGVIFWLVS
jgi:hypothetical protein